jgi:hypothetical protein
MRKILSLLLLSCWANLVFAQHPDGTIVLSNKKGIVGRVARRITGGDEYTHVGIVIDGYVYESDYPRSKRTPVAQYGKRRTTNDYYHPIHPVDVGAMRDKANSMLGLPYSLKNYVRPGSVVEQGMWCSPFVGKVLNAGGFRLSEQDYYEPQNLLQSVGSQYRFYSRVNR